MVGRRAAPAACVRGSMNSFRSILGDRPFRCMSDFVWQQGVQLALRASIRKVRVCLPRGESSFQQRRSDQIRETEVLGRMQDWPNERSIASSIREEWHGIARSSRVPGRPIVRTT